jgi:hypothetical protein
MSEKQIVVQKGIGFLPLLALLFIGLKLGGVITWSWLWVLAPLWVPIAIGLGLLALIAIVSGLVIFGMLGVKFFSEILKKRK